MAKIHKLPEKEKIKHTKESRAWEKIEKNIDAQQPSEDASPSEANCSVTKEDVALVNLMTGMETKKILYALVGVLMNRDDPQDWAGYIMRKFK